MRLDIHTNYTQNNCRFECLLHYTIRQMNGSDPCVPWYFPVEDGAMTRMCTPWEAYKFREIMKAAPKDICTHCLADCSTTKYKAHVTSSPFRHCDNRNFGLAETCSFESQVKV